MNDPEPPAAETFIARQLARFPAPISLLVARLLSLVVGVLAAVVLHYVLYRVGLPSKPFIYVAF